MKLFTWARLTRTWPRVLVVAAGFWAIPSLAAGPVGLGACATINVSGSYVLTQNVFVRTPVRAGSACLTVRAPDVVIDLAGFSIGANGQGVGIASSAPNLTITNGMLSGFSIGIQASAGEARLDGVVVANSGTGAQVGNDSIVRYSRFLGNHGDGLDMQSGIIFGSIASGNNVGFNVTGSAIEVGNESQ